MGTYGMRIRIRMCLLQAMGELYGGLTQIDFMRSLAGLEDVSPVLAALKQIGKCAWVEKCLSGTTACA